MACWVGIAGVSVSASSFRWFLGSFRWFLLVEGDFRWFRVVWCFSSYTNYTAYRRVNPFLNSWMHVIDWGHSIILFKAKKQEKDYCCLVTWSSKMSDIFCILLSSMSDKKKFSKEIFWINSHKASRSIAKYLTQGVFAGSVLTGRLITGRLFAFTERRGEMSQNGEISLSDGERRQVCRIVRWNGFSLS